MNLVFEDHHVFFLTPQILLNNINNKRISLSDVSLLIFDECHHTRKHLQQRNEAIPNDEEEGEKSPTGDGFHFYERS